MKNLVILAMATHAVFSCGHDDTYYDGSYQNIDVRIEAVQNGRYIDVYKYPPPLVSSGHFLEFTGLSSDIVMDSRVSCEWRVVCGNWTHVNLHEWGTCRTGWTIPVEYGSYDDCRVNLTARRAGHWGEKDYRGEASGRFRFDNR